jgi:2-polyprenyl-3-methyl-5-hydroxy-6-metoxy-1,4-benzoquinol methylase
MNRQKPWRKVAAEIAVMLEEADIGYMFAGTTALAVQGVAVPEWEEIEVSVQWDNFAEVHDLFQPYGASGIEKHPGWDRFAFEKNGVSVSVLCVYNTVIVTDPERVAVQWDGQTVYAKSVEHFRRTLAADDPRMSAIHSYLKNFQSEHSRMNEAAWNQSAYDAWVTRYGTPEEAAEYIKKDPEARLAPLTRHIGELRGKKVVNLLGSHGSKAVAMALLGAEATVVDISRENAAYANDLARTAGVNIHYVVSDVLELPQEELTGDYDLVLMELGILHYFIDLKPLAEIIAGLLGRGGRLVLHDFHPVSTKLITSKGKKHKVTGNYFDTSLEFAEVAFSKHLPEDKQRELPKVRHRKWTLGEIVTAIASAGLFISLLEEEPNTKVHDMGIPKTFTLVAKKV